MKAHFMANHCFTDKRIIEVLELNIKDSETKYNESITMLIEPTVFTNTITRSKIVSNPSNESIIFDTRENKPAVNNAMFDRLIAPFYGVMKQESTQKKIQEKMTNRMIGIFANLAKSTDLIKDVLVKYIYLPDSMTQMVLTRAKHFAKDKPMNIQSFMTFYLLKKYLYWGRASHQLGLPENPRIVGLTKENRDDYINQFNTTMDESNKINPSEQSQVENLFSTTNQIGRQITRPVDNLKSRFDKAAALDKQATIPGNPRQQTKKKDATAYNQNPKKTGKITPKYNYATAPAGGKGKRTRRKSRVHCRRTYKIRKSKHC